MKTLHQLAGTLLPLIALAFSINPADAAEAVKPTGRTVVAEVVAFDQSFMLNRIGSSFQTPRIFALRKDVTTNDNPPVPLPGYKDNPNLVGFAGNVSLEEYKRARPIVLRANVGDILEIRFTNLLTNQTQSKFAGLHVVGLSLADSIDSDSSWVGQNNNNSLAANAGPKGAATGGPSRTYRYFVDAEGVFILYSAADPVGANNTPDETLNEVGNGLFGCVIVQPPHAEYYRSQVLRSDLIDATYHSRNLPANMVLSLRPKQPGEKENEEHWFLTTYRTRLLDFVTKSVEVVIGDAEKIQELSAPLQQNPAGGVQSAPKAGEYKKPAPAPRASAPHMLLRVLKTGESKNALSVPADANVRRLAQEKGELIPEGHLYSPQTRHPLVDYGIAYTQNHARPAGWPVLEMLYPEAVKVLAAQKQSAELGNQNDPKVYKLKQGDKSKYRSAITQLDTGNVPRELWPVLDAWGIREMPGIIPQVGSQRDYFDGGLQAGERISRAGTQNYIWLLTGIALNGQKNSSVIIHGNETDLTLRFVQVELQLFHSDLTAIITGPQAEGFGNSQNSPSAFLIPASPERAEPYREFALGYHNGASKVNQAFQNSPSLTDGKLNGVLNNGGDNFGINYGVAGIGAEILANRLGFGPEGFNRLGDGTLGWNNDSVDLKFEEFFLSSWAVGDPAMLVDRPANAATTNPPGPGDRATKAFYPDDPSNVYHSYMRDHVKMRVYNAGASAPHVHHLHAHQWLRSPNSDEASYLDSQLIVPGSAFSLEITYNGSGNRNQTVGDSIFHCHFYPHFAQGMWSLWRVHDVFEEGTPLDDKGKVVDGSSDPKKWVRALPDAEIATGTPIPAIVPLPTLAMPPIPPPVRVTKIPDLPANPANQPALAADVKQWVNISKDGKNPSMGRMAQVKPDGVTDGELAFSNPGYPFFVPGVAGHRPPHPPLDMGWEEKDGLPVFDEDGHKVYIDGGLPRHQVLGGRIVREFHTPWDFTKDYVRYEEEKQPDGTVVEKPVDGAMVAYRVPEDGTPIEKAAMKAHATRTVKTVQPDGRQGNYIHNGLAPVSGAPFADPGVDDEGNAVRSLRKYKAAVIQKDVVLNKAGWHYPQQRFITLWQDVKPTFDEKRPAQPFFFRANSGETVEYWHTNLVPEYYELDDYQVRTPTDIIGQHIHLVKFDVLASDGAVNGFNYEDGTISADDVRGRIHAITRPFAQTGVTYNLFEMLPATEAAGENYVAGIDWASFVKKTPVPTAWEGSYLQKEMSDPKAESIDKIPKDKRLVPPPGQNWNGAMTTIQRFSTDPLLNNQGIDRTVRTVFTHDHFGPSTHQQAGLYAGFLVEPENSIWRDPVTGGLLYDPVTRSDGGPTGWEAIIEPPDLSQSYREFALEFQDLQLAYKPGTQSAPGLKEPRPMATVNFGDFQNPVTILSTTLPAPNTPVSPAIAKTLLQYGISLSGQAKFVSLSSGIAILDEGPLSLYRYGANEPAFSVRQNGANIQLKFLHGETWSDGNNVIKPPKPKLQPQIISGGGGVIGTYSVNYRNEPLETANGARVVQPAPDPNKPDAGDMSFAYASIDGRGAPWDTTKPNAAIPPPGTPPNQAVPVASLFNRPVQPDDVNGAWNDTVGFAAATNGVNNGHISNFDPYTPLLRGYLGDKVQVRTLVGAHTQPHSFTISGVKWLGEMKSKNSGMRNAQEMGISEHFEFEFELPPASTDANRSFADYLYAPSSGTTGQANGLWGILRSYDNPPTKQTADFVEAPIDTLRRLPKAANPRPYDLSHGPLQVTHPAEPDVEFSIKAQSTTIVYNKVPPMIQNQQGFVYVVTKVRAKKGGTLQDQKKDGTNVTTGAGAPLILRAPAGAWIKVILSNELAVTNPPPLAPSTTVGLHPQLVGYDVSQSDGAVVGFNKTDRILKAGDASAKEYWWFAGDLEVNKDGGIDQRPRELGAINLCPAAPLHQDGNGLVGALIIEPEGATWKPEDYVTDSAQILASDNTTPLFKEFVLIEQTNIAATTGTTMATSAVNNLSADLGFRLGTSNPPVGSTTQALSSSLPTPTGGPPNTPLFVAKAGEPVRFRVLQPGGDSTGANIMFEIHGHSWQQEPWAKSSRILDDNPKSNVLGADILVPHKGINILIDKAGGPNGVPGDYLYYNFLLGDGAWGIFRVTK